MSTILEYKNLTVKHKGVNVLDSVNISFTEGKSYAISGPSGCGKSLLLKLAAGLATPASGTILINGKNTCANTKKVTSYLPDTDFLSDFKSVASVVSLYTDFFSDFDKNKALTLLSEAKISLKDKIRELSHGTLKKLCVILTLSRNAKLFLLDNPLIGTDPAVKNFILKIIAEKRGSATLLITTNTLTDTETITDETVMLLNGNAFFKEVAKC